MRELLDELKEMINNINLHDKDKFMLENQIASIELELNQINI